jgi:hypothetical protein
MRLRAPDSLNHVGHLRVVLPLDVQFTDAPGRAKIYSGATLRAIADGTVFRQLDILDHYRLKLSSAV